MWAWLARRLVPDAALALSRGPWSFLYADGFLRVRHAGFMPEAWLFVDGRKVTGQGEWLEPGQHVHVVLMYPEPGEQDLLVSFHA